MLNKDIHRRVPAHLFVLIGVAIKQAAAGASEREANTLLELANEQPPHFVGMTQTHVVVGRKVNQTLCRAIPSCGQ